MFRSNSPFGKDTSSYAGSIHSNACSTSDEVLSQASCMSRPSAKSIYLQRKVYAESVNKMINSFQYRVEHLFTCYLDGKKLSSVADCVEHLKLLDRMGRVWGQNMLLEVRDGRLLLTDIESKEELESIPLSDILEFEAVLASATFDSLLTVSVQCRTQHSTRVFMFQCENVGAPYVQRDLSQAVSQAVSHRQDPNRNEGLTTGHMRMKNIHNAAKPSEPKDFAPHWTPPDYNDEDDAPEPEPVLPKEEETSSGSPHSYAELDRNVDILNHILNDLEIFMGKVAAIMAKNAKKKKKGKGEPPAGEFAVCFHKIKCAFNLLGDLNGKIHNPTVTEFVHSLFSTLAFLISHCPEDLPPSIVAPLLTPQCVRLMSEEASAEEDQIWQALGDAWNIPSTQWPDDDEDIPEYRLEFFDGWQPPEVKEEPESKPSTTPVSKQTIELTPTHVEHQTFPKWTPPPPAVKARSGEKKLGHVQAMYDFTARNHRELTITKGEVVELLDNSKLWWRVRNSRGEDGFVPSNLLKADKEPEEHTGNSTTLTRKSKPVDVKAWLEHMGFSKITVRCLGVLSGSALLGMTRQELKVVCPEEGGRVFFQLQAVRSALDVN